MEKSTLIVFTRFPQPGYVKTRLIPSLGSSRTTDLHRRLVEHVVRQARLLREKFETDIEINITGAKLDKVSEWLGDDLNYSSQSSGDLGDRMASAFAEAADRGATRMVLIGSDLPGLKSSILQQSFDALESHDVVIGPAIDGGYYLIGMKKPIPALFSDITWSTGQVCEDTIANAKLMSLTTFLLEPLSDVDVPADLLQVGPFLENSFRGISGKEIDSPEEEE